MMNMHIALQGFLKMFDLAIDKISGMKRILEFSFLLILGAVFPPMSSFAQQQSSSISKERISKVSGEDFVFALGDFKKGEARLYCQGGFSPEHNWKMEKRFYKRFKVVFYELGCVSPRNLSELVSYNEAVFELLSFRYGSKWQKMVNINTLGFEEWKKKQ